MSGAIDMSIGRELSNKIANACFVSACLVAALHVYQKLS